METNLVLFLVAILAGAFSVLTPCVLVMLPVILAVSGASGRRRVLGVLVGLEVSFIGISLLAAAALASLGLPPRTQELVSVAIIGVLGITLLVPAMRARLEIWTSSGVSRLPGLAGRAGDGEGFRGGVIGGLGLGLVWAPCAGPFLAAITAGAVSDGFTSRTVLMAVGFGLGMLGPLLLVMRGGHAMVTRLRARVGARTLDNIMGSAMLVTAVLIATGGFTRINRMIAENVSLSSTPIAGFERATLDRAAKQDIKRVRSGQGDRSDDRPSDAELEIAGYPESDPGELSRLGPAPKLAGIGATYNLPAAATLDDAFLRGKVVVYDFWTYSCINCIRTLPYLRTLHERYAKDGLVIVGVHAPEFAFERDESNVRAAIDDLDVTWPVATDPDLATWAAFHNRYWPAKYIADRDGELRYTHFGEGGYDETEAVIRELLDKPARERGMPAPPPVDFVHNTPETYLGWQRLNQTQWRSRDAETGQPVVEGSARYELDGGSPLEQDQFALLGRWDIEGERAVAAATGSELRMHYRARAVYLVLDPGSRREATVVVRDAASEGGGTRRVRVTDQRLYTLRDGASIADAVLSISLPAGVSAYAFTFG